MAGDVEPPTQVWAHGFLTVGGKKMSKTNATGIHPFELLDVFGVDSYRYYFMREIQFGQDGSFSYEAMVERHNADLANGLGQPREPRPRDAREQLRRAWSRRSRSAGAESDLPAVTAEAAARYQTHMQSVELSPGAWPPRGRSSREPTTTWSRRSPGRSRTRRAATSSRASSTPRPKRSASSRC